MIGAGLLALPLSTQSGDSAPPVTAIFTAVSAISVTGLATVDTAEYWSPFGQVVILGLIQLGGFGITTMASLLGILVFRRMGLRSRLSTQTERNELDLGGVRNLVAKVALYFLVAETIGFVLLTAAALFTTDFSVKKAAWFGLFHSVSAFNNAGFATFSDNLMGFSANPAVLLIIGWLIAFGGIGYPVLADLARHRRRWKWWSIHTKITLATTFVLTLSGAVTIGMVEWGNASTFGPLGVGDRLVNSWFASVTPRTAGFNSIDYGVAEQSTLLITHALMFIGGGSASTAGGIKVTTFAVLGFVIWAEMAGHDDVNAFGRRIDHRAQRQAVTVALIGVGLGMGGTLLLVSMSSFPAIDVSFEVLSALNTVGLSTGITASFSSLGQLVLTALMFMGRLGPLTVGTALVLRNRQTLYQYPEGRPLLG